MGKLDDLRESVEYYGTAPTMEEMPRRTLFDKGIYGPTGAHVIEEIHTPFNLEYITVTTGTTAFQNIVGVTKNELESRKKAAIKALELASVKRGEDVIITYPPLVNVFPKAALDEYGLNWAFLKRSGRDALILALAEHKYSVVVGESSFLRAALEDAKRLNMLELLSKDIIFITAGTPLDLAFLETAKKYVNGKVHDLYGCQEFGWLTLDGILLRNDITLIKKDDTDYHDLIVGGLPTGDRFPVSDNGHACNSEGKIITYSRVRTDPDYEVTVLKTTANSEVTISRLTRSILRTKAKIVRVSRELEIEADRTVLVLSHFENNDLPFIIEGPEKTEMFDSLLQAQMDYQSQSKTDPSWIKER